MEKHSPENIDFFFESKNGRDQLKDVELQNADESELFSRASSILSSTNQYVKLPRSNEIGFSKHVVIPRDFLLVKHFKRVGEQVKLNRIGPINYLEGKNGHGKSSILNAISYLSKELSADGLNSVISQMDRSLFTPGAEIKMQLGTSSISTLLVHNKLVRRGSLPLRIVNLKLGNEQGFGTEVDPGFPDRFTKAEFDYLEQGLELARHPEISPKRIVADPFDDEAGRLGFFQGDREVYIKHLSQGVQSLYKLFKLIDYAILESSQKGPQTIIVLIEEPENNLHPGLQKDIPNLLQHYIDEYDDDGDRKIMFFVSTHSPFIIGSAGKHKNQRIYLVEEGELLEKKESDGKSELIHVEETSGYNGKECAWVVSQMLGGDVTDLGYPENYCLLEENSLYQILKSCVDKGILANYQFIAAGGLTFEISLESRLNELSKLDTLVKCNPYYWNTYRVIMDNTGRDAIGKKVQQSVEKMKNRLGDRFTELSKDTLEEYYSNINEDLHRRASEHIARAAKGPDKGKAKEEAAKWVADSINSREDFTRLFGGELDFLFQP
jgi:hypothetical protein